MAVKKSTDIFEKCTRFTKAKELMSVGLYPYFRTIESAQDPEVSIGGRRMIMVGSNNYLGLTNHPKVKEAALSAIRKYGSGCAGSRFLNGTLTIHVELEEKLARFIRKEAALIFSTGFQVNLGVISALVGKDDIVIIDKMDHASIIDGCRLSYGEVRKFRHNDMADLERILEQNNGRGKLIVVDGVFSMEGDIVNLPRVVELAKAHGARLMVDDAHGIGVLGKTGRGTAEHFGLEGEVDLIMGTYSKSLASIGGFISGSEEVVHYIKHFARSLIFSASPPPASVAAVSAAVDIIENEPERLESLWKNTRKMLAGLKDLGFELGPSETPIIPILVGNNETAFKMAMMLQDEGVFANVAVSPAVPEGRALIRTSYMATHTDEQLDKVLNAFKKVGKAMGLIP
ncbi:MAG TPA: pyridoxal phosphate-dependent aminotransferase family protein [Thermodesulfovibrionales bacterium]|jgi:8-amino-7-oxononanoate synthase|nr:pyridoxal phosphate-dependent aminotransferase family protein [Thermodesulfovibrionales bacterium]